MLTPADRACLDGLGLSWATQDEQGWTCLVITGWPLPPGYTRRTADLLLRLSPGYPDIPLDMWWFDPAVMRADGQGVPQTEVQEQILGRIWQRWSRHLAPGQWMAGVDGVESYVARLRAELRASSELVVSP